MLFGVGNAFAIESEDLIDSWRNVCVTRYQDTESDAHCQHIPFKECRPIKQGTWVTECERYNRNGVYVRTCMYYTDNRNELFTVCY